MLGLSAPVCLTRSAPFKVNCQQLVFYDVVDSKVTSRSSVLSTIAEAGGEAKLPAAITQSEFKSWIAAVEDKNFKCRKRSLSFLCTVAKVADALDDKGIDEWMYLAAEKLLQYAPIQNPKRSMQKANDVLSLVSENVQYRIFSAAASDPSRLHRLLAFLPSHFHATIIAATSTVNRQLNITLDCDGLSALKAIPALPALPEPGLSLHAHDDQDFADRPQTRRQIAGHLAHALRHHSSLTTLSVSSRNIDAASARRFLPALTALTALQSLHLGTHHSYFPAESIAMLQRTLPNLPHLQDLIVMLIGSPEDPATMKRPRNASAPRSPATCCLTTALSPATALTSLHLHISEQPARRYFTAGAPLRLPNLTGLTADFEEDPLHLATSFMLNLTAPLTRLKLDDYIPQELPATSVDDTRRFLTGLARFPHLIALCTTVPVDAQRADDGANGVVTETVFDEMMSRSPTVFGSLQHLEDLAIGAEWPVVHRLVSELTAPLTGLTFLGLTFARCDRSFHGEVPWPDVCGCLCRLSNLQQLGLSMNDRVLDGHGLSLLQPLTQLVSLRVTGWICVHSVEDCEAVAGMTGLQALLLSVGSAGDMPADDAARALLALSALTHLVIGSLNEVFDEALVEALREFPAREAWPALQELSVDAVYGRAADIVRCAAMLPAVQKLRVRLDCLEMEDAVRVAALEEACQGVARAAGVQLTLLWPDDVDLQ